MTFWTILVLLCLLAVVFAVWPLYRKSHRLSPMVAGVIVFVVATAAILYDQVGRPGVPSGPGQNVQGDADLPSMNEALTSLRARLEENPDDMAGWKMLARTEMAMQEFAGAVETYEHIMAMEEGKEAQTLVDLAVALINRDGTQIEGRPATLLDNALAMAPTNPAALFYTGLAAANRGDTDTAAARWEILLGQNPPENVRGILEQRLAEWRGETPPAHPAVAEPAVASDTATNDSIISANISLSDEARTAVRDDASVFIIARDPAAPTPPIAVSRHRVSDLPAVVSMNDAQSMVAGRNLSGFAELEVIARVSMSGQPGAASGDWFGSRLVRPAEQSEFTLTIDQQVP